MSDSVPVASAAGLQHAQSVMRRSEMLDSLARRYRGALIRFFVRRERNLGSEAEDLTHEVFLRLANRSVSDDIEHVQAYLFQTAAAVLVDRTRRGAVRHEAAHIEFDTSRHAEEAWSPERVYIGEQQLANVLAGIKALPERTRAVFTLHRFEGLRYADIARRLSISTSTVEKHIMEALRHLTAIAKADE